MIKLTGIHSDSWCLIFPHPKEIIKKDITNYVCALPPPFFPPPPLLLKFIQSPFLFKDAALNGKNHRFILVAPYKLCEGTDHLEKIFQDIMDQGGEGIILRDPYSPQQSGRSSGFLKHKVLRLHLPSLFY